MEDADGGGEGSDDLPRRDDPLRGEPADGLRASLALRRQAERVEAAAVAGARRAGWSWQQIGDALGVTRQAVHAKYGKEVA